MDIVNNKTDSHQNKLGTIWRNIWYQSKTLGLARNATTKRDEFNTTQIKKDYHQQIFHRNFLQGINTVNDN